MTYVIDLIFLTTLLWCVFTGEGGISSLVDLMIFFLSFAGSIYLYPFISQFLVFHLHISKGLGNGLGFFLMWIVIETLLIILCRYFMRHIPDKVHRSGFNRLLGIIPSILYGSVIFTFFLHLIFVLPISSTFKSAIHNSRVSAPLMMASSSIEKALKPVLNDAVIETLNFLTVKETSRNGLTFDFSVDVRTLTSDSFSEITMLTLINKEREKNGLKRLRFDESLRMASRQYATQMFGGGFFSHYSAIDGSSPAQRLDRQHISYTATGENLALAPDVYIAHTGLINSEGHRENILSPLFSKVGIGVIDGGVFGKIFVQEFTD